MSTRTLAQLTRDLRKLVKHVKTLNADTRAKYPAPKLSPWDKRRPVVIVTGGPNYSLL